MDQNDLPPPQPLFDLTGMGPEDAKDYVLTLVTHLKQTEAALRTAEEEAELWEKRVALAQQAQQTELENQAAAQLAAVTARKSTLELEVQDFRLGIEKVKKQLQLLPLTQRSVNTDLLQENLAKLAGPLDAVTPTVKRIEAEDALAALKKRLAEKG